MRWIEAPGANGRNGCRYYCRLQLNPAGSRSRKPTRIGRFDQNAHQWGTWQISAGLRLYVA